MYLIIVENGVRNFNKEDWAIESGYLQEDITNGTLTKFDNIKTKVEVKKIVNRVKYNAAEVYVFKLVKIKI